VPLVIDALGGNQKVATLTEATGKVVSHWRSTRKFPANSYVAIKEKLKAMGLSAPDELWAMRSNKRPKLKKAIKAAVTIAKRRKKR
jgi:hypothetical protein